jgi:hypothetical protein
MGSSCTNSHAIYVVTIVFFCGGDEEYRLQKHAVIPLKLPHYKGCICGINITQELHWASSAPIWRVLKLGPHGNTSLITSLLAARPHSHRLIPVKPSVKLHEDIPYVSHSLGFLLKIVVKLLMS